MTRLTLLFPVLALSGCPALEEHDCTLMYVPDQLNVSFDAASWPAGVTTVTISGDVTATCTVTLPGDTDGSCDVQDISIMNNDAGDALSALSFFAMSPANVTIVIDVDGTEIASETLTPTYEVSEPNGEGCGETHSASVTMIVD